jgi:hypothetical protein
MLSINCGGGGGGSTSETPVNPPPVAPESLSIINGTIYVGETTGNYPEGLVSVVGIISVDKDGNEIDRKSISTSDGKFSLNIGLNSNGGSIVITVNAEGYTPGTKTIYYNSPKDFRNLMISVRIDPVAKKVVSITEIKVSSNCENVAKINFYEGRKGYIYTADVSSDPLRLSVAIPVEKLQTDVENILVEYKGYKPSDPDDYQNFPGEYTDNDEQLISVGFFTLDIKDLKTGKNPFTQEISTQLVKGRGEYYRLLSFVDCQQLNKIKGVLDSLDEDPQKNGIQLSFYAFDWDKGKWVKAGVGTFVSSQDVEFEKFGEDINTIDTVWDYIIFNGCIDNDTQTVTPYIDVNGDSLLDDVSCRGNYVITNENDICTSVKPVYVVVSVTNPQLQWKNLDYIKPASGTIEFTVVVKDDEGNPVATPVFVVPSNDQCIEFAQGYTSQENGQAHLQTLKYCDPSNAYIGYINPFTGMYVEDSQNTVTVEDGSVINITIVNPLKCKITGVVKNEQNVPLKDIPVYAYSDYLPFYRTVLSNNSGVYTLDAPCDVPVKVVVSYREDKALTANINGVKDGNEDNDDGSTAYMQTFVLGNYPPEGYGYLSTYSTKWGSTVEAYLYAWDYEGDLPIRYKLKLINQDNDVVKSYTGTVSRNYAQTKVNINTSDLPKTADVYKVVLILVDRGFSGDIGNLSQEYTEIEIGDLHVNIDNSPPTIIYFYPGQETVSKVGSTVTLYGNGYDIDGDPLSSRVSYRCFDNDENLIDEGYTPNGDNILTEGYEEFAIPANPDIKRCEFVWELSDGKATSYSQTVDVEIKNSPPSVYIWPEEYVVSIENETTTIYAIVSDPDGDDVTCNWYINGVLDNDQHSCQEYILSLEGYDPNTDIEIRLEASDGIDVSFEEITIHYGKPGDLEIIIQ